MVDRNAHPVPVADCRVDNKRRTDLVDKDSKIEVLFDRAAANSKTRRVHDEYSNPIVSHGAAVHASETGPSHNDSSSAGVLDNDVRDIRATAVDDDPTVRTGRVNRQTRYVG